VYYVTYLMDGRERVREMLSRNMMMAINKYPMKKKAAGRPPKRPRLGLLPEVTTISPRGSG